MKRLYFLSFLFFLNLQLVNSQSGLMVVDYTATNPTAPGNCDATFTVNSITNNSGPFI